MSDNGAPRCTGGGWVLPGGTGDTPIIDAHYHIFPRLGSQPEGIPPALRLKFWQYHSREWIDFWRTDAGEHVGKRLLEFASHSIADMPDVGFCLTDQGQAEITVDGVTYRMQIYPPSLTNNDPTFDACWRMVEERALPVFWFLDDRALDRVGLFMRRVAELDEWTRLHPDVPCVITHGLVPAAIIHQIGVPEELLRVLERPQVHAELLMPAKWPDYPYPESRKLLRRLRDRVGAESLLWGSDSPYGMSEWCIYRQLLDFIRVHCDFLSAAEKALILGGNTVRLFGLERSAPRS